MSLTGKGLVVGDMIDEPDLYELTGGEGGNFLSDLSVGLSEI